MSDISVTLNALIYAWSFKTVDGGGTSLRNVGINVQD